MRARCKGLTLIEVMLVMALVGLTLACVAQMFRGYVDTLRFSTSKDRATQVAMVALDRLAGELKAAVTVVSITPDVQLTKDGAGSRPPQSVGSLPMVPFWRAHVTTETVTYVFDPLAQTLARRVGADSQVVGQNFRAFNCTSTGTNAYRLVATVEDGKLLNRYALEVFRMLP